LQAFTFKSAPKFLPSTVQGRTATERSCFFPCATTLSICELSQ